MLGELDIQPSLTRVAPSAYAAQNARAHPFVSEQTSQLPSL